MRPTRAEIKGIAEVSGCVAAHLVMAGWELSSFVPSTEPYNEMAQYVSGSAPLRISQLP